VLWLKPIHAQDVIHDKAKRDDHFKKRHLTGDRAFGYLSAKNREIIRSDDFTTPKKSSIMKSSHEEESLDNKEHSVKIVEV